MNSIPASHEAIYQQTRSLIEATYRKAFTTGMLDPAVVVLDVSDLLGQSFARALEIDVPFDEMTGFMMFGHRASDVFSALLYVSFQGAFQMAGREAGSFPTVIIANLQASARQMPIPDLAGFLYTRQQ